MAYHIKPAGGSSACRFAILRLRVLRPVLSVPFRAFPRVGRRVGQGAKNQGGLGDKTALGVVGAGGFEPP